jgi:hypothetical protein
MVVNMAQALHRTLTALATAALTLPLAFSLTFATQAATAPVETIRPVKVYALPGQLNNVPVFNSNSPELVGEEGILLSSLPGPEGSQAPFLNYAFEGDFSVFSHHIAKDKQPGERLLYLGLLASNQSDQPVKLQLKAGASYLSQPDAIFRSLPPLVANPDGRIYAGPGDRVATELLAGKSQFPPNTYELPPRSTVLLSSLPIPTDVAILPPINGRSTLMHFHSDGPVYLSQVARFAQGSTGAFQAPTLDDYREVLNARQLAGPRDLEPTAYDPQDPPPTSNFRYGRVAGIQKGSTWNAPFFEKIALLQMPAVGETNAYPISSLYLKRYGTSQNQSAPMLRRYPDTAYQSQGNYGVTYELQLPFNNPDPVYRNYILRLSHPAKITGSAPNVSLTYIYPPDKQVVFRGSVRLQWTDEFNQKQDHLLHVVLRNGEEAPPLALLTIPPGRRYDLKMSFIYPADATAPQLFTIERLD